MKVECVHCGATGRMDETRIPPGVTSIRCPRCKESFPIPVIGAGPDAVPAGSVVPAPPQAPLEPPKSLQSPLSPGLSQPFPPPPVPPAQSPPSAASDMAQCGVCYDNFPREEMVRFGTSWVCAACKPGYVQMLTQGSPRPGEMRYAGFWIRVGAKILDGLILSVVSMFTSFGIGLVLPKSSPGVALAAVGLSFVFQTSVGAAYSGYFLGKNRATPGKMACGLMVVSPEGNRISVWRGVGRYFAEMLSSMILCIGYLMVLFDDEKRALHDRICDTRVVYK